MSHSKVAAVMAGFLMVVTALPTAVAEEPEPVEASSSDDPIRLIVGFRTLPEGLSSGGEFLGAHIVRIDRGLQFVVVNAISRASFEERARAEPGFRYVEEDKREQWIAFTPNDPQYSNQYGPGDMRLPEAWDLWRGSTDKTVCVVDTGIRGDHEDFVGGRYVGGYDYVNGDSDPSDDQGHGTHVAGTAAASIDNAKGVAGMGNVRIRAVKVLDAAGNGYTSDVASGIRFCSENSVGVISMSLGGSASTTLASAVDDAWNTGSLLVAATGNDGCSPCVLYPAAYENVIAVGCVTTAPDRCYFSNGGPEIDVVAPGYDIISTYHSSSNAYQYASGTSMSTPHVSGVAALVWSKQPALTNTLVRAAIESTAWDLGAAGWDATYGYGLVNARLALDAAYPTVPLPIVAEETFDDGIADGFALTGLWHVSGTCDSPPSAPNYLGYNDDNSCTYDTIPLGNAGTATKTFDLTQAIQANLNFKHRFEHESASTPVDQKRVQISIDGGASWTTLWLWDARTADQPWNEVNFSLSPYVGHSARIRLSFDTVDALDNAYAGWFIDNIRVSQANNWPPIARAGADVVIYDANGDGLISASLSGTTSVDVDGTIASARWRKDSVEIGSGLQTTAALSVGVHSVILNITDNEGAGGEDEVVIDVRPNRAPTADFSYSCSGLRCTFNASLSSDPDGPLAGHAWDFGDGATSQGPLATHDFADFVPRAVSLNVTDAAGSVARVMRSVIPGTTVHFESGFDQGPPGGLDLTGLWHVSESCLGALSPPAHLAFRRATACDFATGAAVAGHAMQTVDLTGQTDARMTFYQIAEAGSFCASNAEWDRRFIYILTPSGAFLGEPFYEDCHTPNTLAWAPVHVNLTPYAGNLIEVHIVFDSSTSANNDKLGWAIDDLRIASGPEPPTARAGPDLSNSDADGTGVEPVTLDARSSSGSAIATYEWSENGTQVGEGNLVIANFAVGVHAVKLRVTDSLGLFDEDVLSVTVKANAPPKAVVADLIESRDIDGNGLQGVAVDGRASYDTDGSLVSYEWDLDGSAIANGSQAVVTASVGDHVLGLTVRDNGNAQSVATAILRVLPNRAPIIHVPGDMSGRDADGSNAEAITLSDAGSIDPDGTLLGYSWFEGDALLGTGSPFTHTFSVGLHAVRLQVTDAGGASANGTLLVDILANRAPTARAPGDVTLIDADGTNEEPVSLVDAGSTDPDGTPLTYAWLEGGVELGTGATLTRTLAVGLHTVTLRVTDSGAGIGEDTVIIDVRANAPPTARMNVTCIDIHCAFNATASGDPEGPVTLEWAFGDGSTASAPLVDHVFPTDGTYTWALTARDIGDSTDTIVGTLSVSREPPRPAPLAAPARPQVYDQNTAEPSDRLPLLDVQSAWFEADYNFLYVGLQARPGASPIGVNYSVSFGPSWTPKDPTWNGTLAGGQTMSTLTAHLEFDTDPRFKLSGLAGTTTIDLGTLNGSWDGARGIAWWQIPYERIQEPKLNVAIVSSPSASSSVLPAALPISGIPRGDSTGIAPNWRLAYTTRLTESVETFDFDESSDGFRKESEQPYSEANWDPAIGAVLLVENRADLRDEVYSRAIATLTPARSFQITARFEVNSRGNQQPSTPLFLAGANVAYPHLEANVLRIGYRDVLTGAGTYTFQVRDAAGVTRMLLTASGPERAHLSIGYDATTRGFHMAVMRLDGAEVANATAVLPAGSTFSLGKLGVSSDGAPGTQQAAPMVAHVDDITLRLR